MSSRVFRPPEEWPLSPMNLWPLTPHLCALCLSQEQGQGLGTGGLALWGTTCPPIPWLYVRSVFWALVSSLHGPGSLHFQ